MEAGSQKVSIENCNIKNIYIKENSFAETYFVYNLTCGYSRGYAEAEIEAVFAKYDLDGDRVLDESEQKKMQQDLEGQKVNFRPKKINYMFLRHRPRHLQH